MDKSEYIQFTYSNKLNIKDCNRVFNLINNCKQNKEKKSKAFWLKNTPDYVIKYFTELEKKGKWSLINLIEFIITDLDVSFLGISNYQNNTVKLNFESNSYPYGGPDSLIIFLKAFNCVANETDEGTGVYNVIWKSNFDFNLKSNKTVKTKGIKKFLKQLFKN
jgi:hypothetical protein